MIRCTGGASAAPAGPSAPSARTTARTATGRLIGSPLLSQSALSGRDPAAPGGARFGLAPPPGGTIVRQVALVLEHLRREDLRVVEPRPVPRDHRPTLGRGGGARGILEAQHAVRHGVLGDLPLPGLELGSVDPAEPVRVDDDPALLPARLDPVEIVEVTVGPAQAL